MLSHEQFRISELVEQAAAAEQAGFGYLWASDHLQPWQDNEGHAAFPWLTLGLVSQRTRAVTFGTGVTCPTYRHHPTDVAQAFATLAGLAPGRAFLGVGTGEAVNELAGTGQFGRYPEQHDRLIEAITLIRQLAARKAPRSPASTATDGSPPGAVSIRGCGLRSSRGARAAGKDPAHMPIFLESFVVVGDSTDVDYAAQRWRFLAAPPTAHLLYQPNPVTIEQLAQQARLSQVSASWVRGTDPTAHITAVQKLLDAGVTPFIHAPQADPRRVIDFYGQRILPQLHT